MTKSAMPAESSTEKMWTLSTRSQHARSTAENGPFFRGFPAAGLTGVRGEDCYTFEEFAASTADIRSNYYYLY
jgi:hypothetical protein